MRTHRCRCQKRIRLQFVGYVDIVVGGDVETWTAWMEIK